MNHARAGASPEVTVVIPCRDVVGVLEGQLAAIAAQDYEAPFEVLLADNGSTDGLQEHVERWRVRYGLDLRHVDASTVRGVSHARNVGLHEARAPVVAVCDADDQASSAWLSALVLTLADHDCAAGPLDVTTLNGAGPRAWRPAPLSDRLPVKLAYLPYAVGANMAVRRDVALRVGAWDEGYVAGGDDVDFSWRVQLAGGRIGFAPGAVMHYRYRDSLRPTASQVMAYTRCEARLLRQYASSGARPYRPSRSRGDVSWLVRRLGDVVAGEQARGRWVCRAATLVGRLRGAVEQRCWVG